MNEIGPVAPTSGNQTSASLSSRSSIDPSAPGNMAFAAGRYTLTTACAGIWSASMWNWLHSNTLRQAFWMHRIPRFFLSRVERFATNRWTLLAGCTLPLLATIFLDNKSANFSGSSEFPALANGMRIGGYWAGVAGGMALGLTETHHLQQGIAKKMSRLFYTRQTDRAFELMYGRYNKNMVAVALLLFGLGLMSYSISAIAITPSQSATC